MNIWYRGCQQHIEFQTILHVYARRRNSSNSLRRHCKLLYCMPRLYKYNTNGLFIESRPQAKRSIVSR